MPTGTADTPPSTAGWSDLRSRSWSSSTRIWWAGSGFTPAGIPERHTGTSTRAESALAGAADGEANVNDILRDRLMRKLDMLPDDQLDMVLDYIEFLDSKYGPRNVPAPSPLTRFAEGVESTLRAGKVSAN